MNILIKSWAILASLIWTISSAEASDKVKNGADRVQADFTLAWTFLPEILVEASHHREHLQLTAQQEKVLGTLVRALRGKVLDPAVLVFVSDISDSDDCLIEEQSKVACTTDRPGDPIFLNSTLFYRADADGNQIPLISFSSAVQILVHELGHQFGFIGPKSHNSLDILGAKVASIAVKIYFQKQSEFEATPPISAETFDIESVVGQVYRGIGNCMPSTASANELCEIRIQFMASDAPFDKSSVGVAHYAETTLVSRNTASWSGIYSQHTTKVELTNGSAIETYHLIHSSHVLLKYMDKDKEMAFFREDEFRSSVIGRQYDGVLFCKEIDAISLPKGKEVAFQTTLGLCYIKLSFGVDGSLRIDLKNESLVSTNVRSNYTVGRFWQTGEYVTYIAKRVSNRDDSNEPRFLQLSADGKRLVLFSGGVLIDTRTVPSSTQLVRSKSFETTSQCIAGVPFVKQTDRLQKCRFRIDFTASSHGFLGSLSEDVVGRAQDIEYGGGVVLSYSVESSDEIYSFSGIYVQAGGSLLLMLPTPEKSESFERHGMVSKYELDSMRWDLWEFVSYRLVKRKQLVDDSGTLLDECSTCELKL